MLEKDIERYLKKKVEKEKGLTYKFVSPGNVGVPDRIVFLKGKVYFVEIKAPNKKPRPSQLVQFKKIQDQYEKVIVLDSIEKVDIFIEGAL